MSRASNSLKVSDVSVTPIKLKYSASFNPESIENTGIQFYVGVNEPVSAPQDLTEEGLVYRSIRHLYYSNYLTGSFPTSASYADNWLQSTAASGTLEADQRIYPTGSYEMVQVTSVPREVFGEKIARRSFCLETSTYNIVDDGNGNIWDIFAPEGYFTPNYFEEPDEYFDNPLAYKIHVGNILYAQGMIIITNQDYLNILGL
jgi:hypothetical protein